MKAFSSGMLGSRPEEIMGALLLMCILHCPIFIRRDDGSYLVAANVSIGCNLYRDYIPATSFYAPAQASSMHTS